jgi:diphthine synthase
MFYVIGLGLSDEKDITIHGLEVENLALLTPNITHIAVQAIRNSTRVYLEAYTSILMVDKERLVCNGN